MSSPGKSEYIIQNVVGCGPFQVTLIMLVFVVTKLSTAFSTMFMAFGNYNPGWRCLDTNSTVSNHTGNSSSEYIKDNCSLFDSCAHVEFNPDTSTIVSEWGLLCKKAWIPSIIISLQMAGLLLGCLIAGQLGDAFGRKTTIYTSQALVVVISTASIFSTSWQMFTVLRILLGVASACILSFYYVYTAEFVTMKWRGPLPNIPFWPASCIIFALTCMYLRDWRQLHIVSAVTAAVGFLPVLWVPESLRWLEIKNKTKKFYAAAQQVAAMNSKTLPDMDTMENKNNQNIEKEDGSKIYTMAAIFRKGYRGYTVLITIPWFSMSLIFYGIGFGVKALSGDFYLNLIIMYAVEIPFTIVPTVTPNLIGRKWSGILFSVLTGICLLTAACFDHFAPGDMKTTGVLVLVLSGRVTMGGFWGIMMTYTAEIYPTVVRGLATSWGSSMARIGGIVAPFLIPKDSSTAYICYMVMGLLGFVCCGIITQLPETRGKALKETFEENEEDNLETEVKPRENDTPA